MKHFNHPAGKTYAVAGGAEIYVQETGNPAGEPMLLLHGGFGNGEDFNPLLPLFKKKYRFIALDSRGQGGSTLGNLPLTYARLQQDVEAVLAALHLSEISVFGMSDGGVVAYRLAAFTNLKIQKIITIGARWSFQNALDTQDQLQGISAAEWKAQFPDKYRQYQSQNPAPDFEKLCAALERLWMDSAQTGYPENAIRNIKCPVLICKGDADTIATREAVLGASEQISHSNLAIIPFAQHLIYPEQKAILMQLVNAFLEG